MGHDFDRDYWDRHWAEGEGDAPPAMATAPPNPHLVRETAGLSPGSALDAGCGAGAEAMWLAARGWRVTAVDLSTEALTRAAARGGDGAAHGVVEWVEADLTTWEPAEQFDLVTTHYAHPAMPQLAFYDRLATWVARGGTLLVVAHQPDHAHGGDDRHGHDHDGQAGRPPAEASATVEAVTARLDPGRWEVVTAEECVRPLPGRAGGETHLHDVVVRALRRG